MHYFSIDVNLIRKISKNPGKYYSNLLYTFANSANPFKVLVDNNSGYSKILELYSDIAKNCEFTKIWLELMSYSSDVVQFEFCEIEFEEVDEDYKIFFQLSKKIKACVLVVYSHIDYDYYRNREDSKYYFEEKEIFLCDKDEAIAKINKSGDINISDSIAALNGGQITKSKKNG